MQNNTVKETKKFLSFKLENEEYGLDILKVREILGRQPITAVPGTPAWLSGVINLRGRIIPVMDLRRRFQMPDADLAGACIITVELKKEGAEMLVGIKVDAVSEVLQLSQEDVESMPGLGNTAAPKEISGLAKGQGKVRILLDVDKVLEGGEGPMATLLEEAGEPVAAPR